MIEALEKLRHQKLEVRKFKVVANVTEKFLEKRFSRRFLRCTLTEIRFFISCPVCSHAQPGVELLQAFRAHVLEHIAQKLGPQNSCVITAIIY